MSYAPAPLLCLGQQSGPARAAVFCRSYQLHPAQGFSCVLLLFPAHFEALVIALLAPLWPFVLRGPTPAAAAA